MLKQEKFNPSLSYSYSENSSNKCKAAWKIVNATRNRSANKPNFGLKSEYFSNYFINFVKQIITSSGHSEGSSRQSLHNVIVQDPRAPGPYLFSDGQNMYNRIVSVGTVNAYIPASLGRRSILRSQVLQVP